jgi:hypothetical protein
VALSEGDKVTECCLKTCRAEDTLDLRFNTFPLTSKVVLRGEIFRDIVTDFDGLSERVKLTISPTEMGWAGAGVSADCQITIPSRAEAFFFYECSQVTQSEFLLSHLVLSTKSVPHDAADRVTLRTNAEGMLSVQHLVRGMDQAPPCTVEFVFLPLADDIL